MVLTVLKIFHAISKIVPDRIAERMDAPLMRPERLARGKSHPTIRMNLSNLRLCICASCPSFPKKFGEALYCASGRSGYPIEERGCNCVICPLYDLCSSFNVAYFCVHGHCGARDIRPMAQRLKDLAGSYLERFTAPADTGAEPTGVPPAGGRRETRVTLHFERERTSRRRRTRPFCRHRWVREYRTLTCAAGGPGARRAAS